MRASWGMEGVIILPRGCSAVGAPAPAKSTRALTGSQDGAATTAAMATDRLLDYLAGTLAEAYRRELDQEENVWRSLPFFAATLALQLTVLVQLRGWLGTITGPMAWVAVSLLGGIAVATVSAIGFLTLSILPANFKHAARHSDLVDYSRQMWTDAARQPGATPELSSGIRAVSAEDRGHAPIRRRRREQSCDQPAPRGPTHKGLHRWR